MAEKRDAREEPGSWESVGEQGGLVRDRDRAVGAVGRYGRANIFPTFGYVLVYREFYGGVGKPGGRRYVRSVLVLIISTTDGTVDLSPPCKGYCRLTWNLESYRK